jgi:hypothetical protein
VFQFNKALFPHLFEMKLCPFIPHKANGIQSLDLIFGDNMPFLRPLSTTSIIQIAVF